MSSVRVVFKVIAGVGDAAFSRLRESGAGRNVPSLALAHDLAGAWGISIDRGLFPDTWWVTCRVLSGLHDPLEGCNLQVDGVGVLGAVETYIAALQQMKG